MESTNKCRYTCTKCNAPLENAKTTFFYLGKKLSYDVLRCPKCGQALIPEELVTTKIIKVEAALEEK